MKKTLVILVAGIAAGAAGMGLWPATKAQSAVQKTHRWEKISDDDSPAMSRLRIPGGWFISVGSGSCFFYPDPDHRWDGGSLP